MKEQQKFKLSLHYSICKLLNIKNEAKQPTEQTKPIQRTKKQMCQNDS